MDVVYLSVNDVLDLHAEAIAQFGGMDGLRSQDLLESAVFQPQQSLFGEDAYPSFSSKAAAYAYFIAMNHAFFDGNKRTAAAAMLTFLYLNGFHLNRPDKTIENVIAQMAAKECSKGGFFHWVELAMKPYMESTQEE